MTKQSSSIVKIIVLIFAVIGVAVAAFFIIKKLQARKAEKDDSLFDDLDELDIDEDDFCCCCSDDEAEECIEAPAEEV